MYVRKKITELKPEDIVLMSFLGIPHAIYPVEVHVESTEEIDGGRIALHGRTPDGRMLSPVIERGYEPDETLIVLSDEQEENSSGIDTSERAVYSLARGDSFLMKGAVKIGDDLIKSYKVVTVVATAHEGNDVHVIVTSGDDLQQIDLPAAKRVRVLKPVGFTL